jgi:RNA polymerase sigma-70 factor (ECF subfamily)
MMTVSGSIGSPSGALEPSSISSTLLEQIRARRPEAWRRLVDLYGPVAYRWCRQLGVSEADAADVVQEVFVAVLSGLDRFSRDRSGGIFGAWLRTVTRHRVIDHFRQRQGKADAQGGTNAYRQLLELAESFDESALSAAVEKDGPFSRRVLDLVRVEFENRTWDAFWQIVIDGQSPAEVAADMGLSITAVYKAKSRVLRRLRKELAEMS